MLSPRREELFLIPGGLQRPADVLIPNWTAGQDTALDVTVISSLQKNLVRKAAQEQGSAAELRYKEKMGTYFDKCKKQGIHFMPLVVESYGGWHEMGVREVERLGAALALQSGLLRRKKS